MKQQVQLMKFDDKANELLRTEIESYQERVREEAKRQAQLRHPRARVVAVTLNDMYEAFRISRPPYPRKDA